MSGNGSSKLEIILGGGSWGGGTRVPDSKTLIPILKAAASRCIAAQSKDLGLSLSLGPHLTIDNSRAYPPEDPGTSEKIMGEALKELESEDDSYDYNYWRESIIIDTKILSFSRGTHERDNIEKSVRESFDALGRKKVRVLYFHGPDRSVPIEKSLETVDLLYQRGMFEEFGISNYKAEDVEEFIRVSKEKGYIRPTIYQGQYSPLARRPEKELLPILRKHDIRFNAYSATAGGFLLGTYISNAPDRLPYGGRYGGTRPANDLVRSWFFKPCMFQAVERFHEGLRSLPSSEKFENAKSHANDVCLRWTAYHSHLDTSKDALLVTGNTVDQLHQNLDSLERGPFQGDERVKIKELIETIWEIVRDEAPAVDI